MTKKLLIVVGLIAPAGCTMSDRSTPLDSLERTYGQTHVEILAKSQLNVALHVDAVEGCPLLGEDVTATFDGMPMFVARGGYDLDSTGCYPIAFWFAPLPQDAINVWEKTNSNAQLVIKDKSTAWGITAGKLFANDFIDDPAHGQITWTDVARITDASTSPEMPITITGNVINYPVGQHVDWVTGYAHPTPSQCAGPGLCSVNLQGERRLGPINP